MRCVCATKMLAEHKSAVIKALCHRAKYDVNCVANTKARKSKCSRIVLMII